MGATVGDGAEGKLWPAKGWMSTGGEEERWNVGTSEGLNVAMSKSRRVEELEEFQNGNERPKVGRSERRNVRKSERRIGEEGEVLRPSALAQDTHPDRMCREIPRRDAPRDRNPSWDF